MGKIFTLDTDTRLTIQDALDDLITELGKNCKLVYPPKWVLCNNCIYDSTRQISSSFWSHGGPVPFPNGTTCPLCVGKGRQAQEVSETLKLLCAYRPRDFFFPMPSLDVRVPDGVVQIKGYLSDKPKIDKMLHLIFQSDTEGLGRQKYKLISEVADRSNIVQGRYFTAALERTN